MLFSSLTFLLYFLPITILVNWVLRFSRTAQNVWLLIASLFFYAWGEPIYVLVLIGSVVMNYVFGRMVNKHVDADKKKAKFYVALACIFNISILVVFKYLGFFASNLSLLIFDQTTTLGSFALPIGISFYTFQALSYVIDVYRKDADVENNLLFVALYITFFPQLVAGPIIKYKDVAHQIRKRKMTWDGFSYGACRFAVGLCKKVLISNQVGMVADHVFEMSQISDGNTIVPVTLAWLGAIAYTLQIYFDFSGYSDMAIGLGRMFGFKFKENFNYPYISMSIVEFWRRWHISLSTWFREYVYIPLGGSRVENNDLVVRNTLIVWLLTGFWHGAEWTFVFWGLWNFIFIIFERIVDFERRNISKVVKHLYFLFVVIIGWIFFRAEDMYSGFSYIGNIFGLNGNGFFSDTALMFLKENWLFFALGILFCMPIGKITRDMVENRRLGKLNGVFSTLYPIVILIVFLICIVYLGKGTYNPFIYFNF